MMKSVLASCRGLNKLMRGVFEEFGHGLTHPLAKALNRFRGKEADKAHNGEPKTQNKG
jgi:hypothetical protein